MVRPVLLASFAVAACLRPASAETVVKGPGDLSINCDDFRLYPNGTIEADKDATLVYPDKKGSFADATFGPKVYSSGGIDLGEWVNKSCKK
ncbi:hypothetical protein [Lichenibacterium dinghuense]|uniref:hypothetical protein n=1 Tax=Lichenibacterium dinghuense TaxID=2895977 RepID=UPI001F456DA4|nr:hypothetical protein [Lichenibacterium sp. 6Y81]